MIFIFASVVLVLMVYNRSFRLVVLWGAAAALSLGFLGIVIGGHP